MARTAPFGSVDDHRRLADIVALAAFADHRGDRLLGKGLQRRIDGGAHDEPDIVAAGDDLLGLVKDPVEEIVRRIDLVGVIDRRGRIAPRRRDLAFGHEAGIDHAR